MARGRIFKKDSGSYAFRVDVGTDAATGKRRQLQRSGFRTKKDAEAALQKILQEVADGTAAARSAKELGPFVTEWLETQRQHLKATTWESYRVAVDRIDQHLGHRPVRDLTPLEIEAFYAQLSESGARSGKPLAPKSVRNTHVVLRKALADAERLGMVARNAASAARPPTSRPPEQRTWDSDQIAQFFQNVAEDRLRASYILAATTGMRRGEVLGLRWADVDLDARQLAIRQTLTTVNYQPVIAAPKSKRSVRVIYLDDHSVDVLRSHRRRQVEERQALPGTWDGSHDLVFRDEVGEPINPDWFSREFTRRVKASGLPSIRFHDLRHSYATLALKAGVHPKIVSERLGHATVGITLDLYSHVTPAIARDAADVVAAQLFSSSDDA
ncbi:MAG: tyrosine-type recombinase/integrase [Actinomycetota bacterium]